MSNKPKLLEEVKQYFLKTPKSQILEDWESVVHTEKVKLINEVISNLEKTDGVKTPIRWYEFDGNIEIVCFELPEIRLFSEIYIHYRDVFYERFHLGLVIMNESILF